MSTGTILVVDDRAENRTLITYLFEGEYHVIEAHDGPTGLAIARDARPDCILLDIAMPGMSGFQVLDELRKDPRTRAIPVIVLTATEDSLAAMDRALQAGAVDYLTKPIDPLRVRIRVRGAMERRRLLDELQELRANFTSMLVHDLRAPLTVISGYAELLETTLAPGADTKMPRYVAGIRESCTRMLRLIRDILDVSRLEAGKLVIDRVRLDLSRMMTEVVDRFEPAARTRRLHVRTSGAGQAHIVLADPVRLDQVFMNLLSNALKFTPDGGAITVTLADAGDSVTVAIEDNGPGIPADELPLLFERFAQTTSGRQSPGSGTGLGLVICRHLIEAHGGRIWVEDAAPGCRFAVSVPKEPR